MSVTFKALWYIESHLDADLSLDAIADVVGVSRFHLSRAFAVSAGRPLAAYCRARRLSLAAAALALGAHDILAVALDAGYSSHEAFTRAFRQHVGLTPEQVREQGHVGNLQLQEPIRMDQTISIPLTSPRIARSDALLIVGLSQTYHQSNAGMPAQWNRFVPYLGHVDGQVGRVAYGVVFNADDTGTCDYLCGVEVKEFLRHPPEFARLRIPPQTYAVFEHRAHISAIAATWKAIWDRGLADAGYPASDGPAFERYGEEFDGRTGLGGVEIWIPIAA